jgi:HK97 family phage prohead protease
MRDDLERRTATVALSIEDTENRAAGTSGRRFTGYAAVFDSDSEPLPFTETIRAGAFTRSLASGFNAKLYVDHDPGRLLATTRAGTLHLEEDGHGLRVRADLPDTTDGRDVAELLRRGDIDSMSFGFITRRDRWSPDNTRREILEADVKEVSVITSWPAYRSTSAKVAA